ncbi:MAG: putative sulfate/molybdate transporter [Betaproteobacteria bacterium]
MKNSGQYSDGIKKTLWDISGAFGDIGVLFPLAVALISKNGLNPTALFLMAGIFYAASALYFRITMPVQPLKAMAAIAIASGLGAGIINAAGVVMGAILICIAVTGLSAWLGSLFPTSVIRGIQLGLGAMLVRTAIGLMVPDAAVAIAAGIVLVVTITLLKKIPPLIPLLILGAVFSFKGTSLSAIGPVAMTPVVPDWKALWQGFAVLVVPQLALTFGNAVVATNETGRLLYGEKAARLNLKSIPFSMGIANIASGIVGGAPMCHGSGGLTAHRKFGATGARSGLIIGSFLIGFALVCSRSSLAVIQGFPAGILGVLLGYVGIQHSLFVKDIVNDKKAVLVAFAAGSLGFAFNNLTIGFLAGLAIHYGLSAVEKIARA